MATGPHGEQAKVVAFAGANQSGRTSMVANLAWIVASNDRPVLVLDWGSEEPGLHRYLKPFLFEEVPAAVRLGDELDATLAATAWRHRPSEAATLLRRYCLPGLLAPIDVLSCVEPSKEPGNKPSSRAVVRADLGSGPVGLGDALTATGYGYVMVDLPTDTAPAAVAQLCDTAVICLRPETAVPARELAEQLRAGGFAAEIVFAAMMYDGGGPDEQRRDRLMVRRELDGLGGPAHRAEVPYRMQHAAHGTLAALVDDPRERATLTATYEGVAALVTGGAVDRQRPVPALVRTRYRRFLRLVEGAPRETVWLGYAPSERIWADWIAAVLRGFNVRVARLAPDEQPPAGANVVVVLSDRLLGSATGRRLPELVDKGADLSCIQVTAQPPRHPFTGARVIDISATDARTAAHRLRAGVWLFASVQDEKLPTWFPGEGPRRPPADDNVRPALAEWEVPPVTPLFVGREAELEALRDSFLPLDAAAPVGLCRVEVTGPSGIGKSELARAYAHRFAGGYWDICWVAAGDRQAVQARLREFGRGKRALTPEGAVEGSVESVLDWLAGPEPGGRWLLVYDDATDDAIRGLVPVGGAGDVIVTATHDLTSVPGDVVSVAGLDAGDSRALLTSSPIGVRGLSRRHGEAICEAVGRAPVALRLAAALLQEFARRMQLHHARERATAEAAEHLLALLDADPAQSPTRRVLRHTVDTLVEGAIGSRVPSEVGAVTVALAQLCAFLAPDRVSLSLLRSKAMLAQLAAAAGSAGRILLRDEAELERVLWTGSRLGLFQVEYGTPGSLRMHRVVQEALRDLMSSAGTRHERHARVLCGLAAFAPVSYEADPGRGEDFAELQRHLVPAVVSGVDFEAMTDVLGQADVAGSPGWGVRTWLVSQIRYLYLTGDADTWPTAIELAEKIDLSWHGFGGADGLPARADELRTRLAVQHANLCRAVGRHRKALSLDQHALAEQRRDLGQRHPRSLMTARSYGADLRFLGRFDEAHSEEEATWRGFRESFGEDHPDTLMAAFNLGVSCLLHGDLERALEVAESSYRHGIRVYGEDHHYVWSSRRNLAIYLGELGRYQEALAHLDQNLRRLQGLVLGNGLARMEDLLCRRAQLVYSRRAGKPPSDRIYATRQLVERFRDHFGPANSSTRACDLSFAVDDHVRGSSQEAIDVGLRCLEGYQAEYGDRHPFTGACRANLALFQRGAGHTGQALVFGGRAVEDLRNNLDAGHPWVLAAQVNHACTLAMDGRVEEASSSLIAAAAQCQTYLPAGHPTTGAAAHNLVTIDRLGDSGNPGAVAAPGSWREVDILLI